MDSHVGAVVPKFGAWNDEDPNSAEQFSDIFNDVREERKARDGKVLNIPRQHCSGNKRGQQATKQLKCCFL